MSASHPPHLPSDEQRLLLHALLDPEEKCRAAWEAWRARVRLDDIDAGALRALPLLLHRLRALGVTDPDLGRYQGVARKYWYENQRTFHQTEQVIEGLRQKGIPVLAIKGIALAHRYYPDPALRPMADGDILVPFAHANAALEWLRAREWMPEDGASWDATMTFTLQIEHSVNLLHPNGCGLDLHWKVFSLYAAPEDEGPFWAAAEPIALRRIETRTLCPTDHFLHTCVHGVLWNRVPSLRWVVDALLILQRDGSRLDWARFIALTRQHRLTLFALDALAFLADEFAPAIPAEVREQLQAQPLAPWQRSEFALMTSDAPLAQRDYSVRHQLRRLRAVSAEWRRLSAWEAQLRYLQLHWQLASRTQVLLRVGQRVLTKGRDRLRALAPA